MPKFWSIHISRLKLIKIIKKIIHKSLLADNFTADKFNYFSNSSYFFFSPSKSTCCSSNFLLFYLNFKLFYRTCSKYYFKITLRCDWYKLPSIFNLSNFNNIYFLWCKYFLNYDIATSICCQFI
jgi:hypothetical protein